MNLREFSGMCFEEIGTKKGYCRYRNSWYRLENEILLGFGMESHRCHGFTITFQIVPLVCGVEIFNTGQMQFQPGGAYYRHTKERFDCCTLDLHNESYCERARAYMLRVFALSAEPFLDGVRDLTSGYEMRRAYDWYNAEGALGDHDLSILWESIDWLYLCALKRYDDCLANAERCAEMIGLDELDQNRITGQLQNMLRRRDYAAIDALLEKNREESLKVLKKHKIIC